MQIDEIMNDKRKADNFIGFQFDHKYNSMLN